MPLQIAPISAHLSGETLLPTAPVPPLPDVLSLQTCAGTVRVEWNPQAPVTPLGQLAFFAHFFHTSGRFENWVQDCPWRYSSPNAPLVRDGLATAPSAGEQRPVAERTLDFGYRFDHQDDLWSSARSRSRLQPT